MAKRRIIGITGGLATGKTTVADMFVAKGAVKIDADEIAHRILEEDAEIKCQVIDFFGEKVLADSRISRRKLAGEVFFDKPKLDKLCQIMHPAIIRDIKEEVERYPDKTIVIDAPLLVEAGLHEYVDIVIVVITDGETQIQRAIKRGISEKEAASIISNQLPFSEKIKFADYIMKGNESLDTIKKGVDEIWKKK